MIDIAGIQKWNWIYISREPILQCNKRDFKNCWCFVIVVLEKHMSIFAIAFPAEAAVPVAQTVVGAVAGAIRPLIGLGLFATLIMLFKPLLTGLLRAALLVISPRKSLKERIADADMKSVLKLHRMARKYEGSDPALAAELRHLAGRG
jgi:hypothetical protein